MKVLTASRRRSGEFVATIPGELVFLPPECSRPGCHCERAFSGLTSHRATTIARVADLDLNIDTLTAICFDSLRVAGYDIDGEAAQDCAEEISELAEGFPVGTLVRRVNDDVEPL